MLFSTEYIVYLWLVPVTLFIILPLFMSVVWLIGFCLKEFVVGRIPFLSEYRNSHFSAKDGLHQNKTAEKSKQDSLEAEIEGGLTHSR